MNFSSLSHMRYLCLLGWVYFWALYLDPTRECLKPINPLIYIGEVRDSCRIHLQTLFLFLFFPFSLVAGQDPWPWAWERELALEWWRLAAKRWCLVWWCGARIVLLHDISSSWSSSICLRQVDLLWLIPSMIRMLRHILLRSSLINYISISWLRS